MKWFKRIEVAARAVMTGKADVKRGDAQRDRGAWPEAVSCYRRHLERRPGDAGIWVQLGNCAKEMGDFATADHAYERAIGLRDRADAHLQQGHLYKLMGRHEAALASYRRAVALDPRNGNARSEMLAAELDAALTRAEPLAERPAAQVLWLDITDFLDYARTRTTLGGIQRVVANLAAHELGGDPAAVRVVPVVAAWRSGTLFALDRLAVRTLVRLMESGEVTRAALDRAIRVVEETRRTALPQKGDVFIAAGAFWVHPFGDLVAALRRRGVGFCLFLHDLIQIRHPQYVAPTATTIFRRQLVTGLTLADAVLTNSAFVASETRAFIGERLDFSVPVTAVPLATELRGHRAVPAESRSAAVEKILTRPFVLCVCTIEARKNHKFLLSVWERLRQAMPGAVPDLVFVGAWGWDVTDLRAAIDRSGALGDWLHIVSGITDDDLDRLYAGCLLTAYVSFVEGFGLPVGESLAHGKPCIAADTTSLPEVGGDFARYVDPHDVEAGTAVFRAVLEDRPALAAWTRRIEADFRPRRWSAFSADFFAQAVDVRASPALPCLMPPGRVVRLGLSAFERAAASAQTFVALAVARGAGWHGVEDWGAWTAAERARLDVSTPLAPGTPVILYLKLRKPDYSPPDAAIRVRVGGIETRCPLPVEGYVRARGMVGPGGALAVELIAAGDGRRASRERYAGLVALAYCASADLAARLDIMETIALAGEDA